MSIKVSVCVTTYNRSALLNRTLESLSRQTRLPDELIISDDCSTDDTRNVVEKWGSCFTGIRYNRNAYNLNMPGNLNVAISLARGKYIANLHDADEFEPTLLEEWERALDMYPEAGFVFCGVSGWPIERESENGIILHDVLPITPGRVFFERHFLHQMTSIVWGTVMARKTVYMELLPFDPTYGFISDVDMWMRMCLMYNVAYVREPLIILDHSPTEERSLTRFNWNWLDNARKIQIANIHRFYADQPDRLRRELNRHWAVIQQIYVRRLLGRVWHRDWIGLQEGLRRCRDVGWPVRLAGVLASD